MSKNISKRRIVVDGAEYRWGVCRSGPFVVWTADGRRTLARSADMPSGVTPFQAANWIRVNIQGRAAIERPHPAVAATPPAPRRVVATDAAQPDAYVLVAESGEYDDYGMTVVEVHLDPQIAKEAARSRNEAQARRRALCAEMYAPIFAEYDRLRALGAGDAAVRAAGNRLEAEFFKRHELHTKEERDFIARCPAGARLPRYKVLSTRLLASTLMPVAA